MSDQCVLARRQLRLAAIAALEAAQLGPVQSPGDWTTPPDKLPAILLRASADRKVSRVMFQPQFTTIVMLELDARVEAVSAEDAQDQIELLGARIEQALFTNQALLGMIEQVVSVDTRIDVSAEGRRHLAGVTMQIGLQCFEAFDPFSFYPPGDLTEIDLHVDTAEPFDASGAYADSAFPASVQPAPRSSGPDGRDEGGLHIVLPQ